MQNIDFFSYIQGAISPSKPHKVKGFRFGSLVFHCILSAHHVLHLCMPASTTSKKEWLLPHLVCQKLDCIGSSRKKRKTDRKKTLFCPLAFVNRVVDVFFCEGVRMYVTQASSIFWCYLSLFFSRPDHTHTHVHTHTLHLEHTEGQILKCWWLGVKMLAGGGGEGGGIMLCTYMMEMWQIPTEAKCLTSQYTAEKKYNSESDLSLLGEY